LKDNPHSIGKKPFQIAMGSKKSAFFSVLVKMSVSGFYRKASFSVKKKYFYKKIYLKKKKIIFIFQLDESLSVEEPSKNGHGSSSNNNSNNNSNSHNIETTATPTSTTTAATISNEEISPSKSKHDSSKEKNLKSFYLTKQINTLKLFLMFLIFYKYFMKL